MARVGMYDAISSNKRKSVLLLICMGLFVMGLAALFGAYIGGKQQAIPMAIMFMLIGLIFSLISGLLGYYKGPALIMSVSGAKKASIETDYQLHNLVEEMCIASGLPKPEVYIIEEPAPNAFATGRDPQHSSIAVTRGLMSKLNRNELMGVIAHEMSHIQNYDIRFATLMTVMVGTIVLMSHLLIRISIFGGARRRSSNNNNSNGQAQLVITILAIVMMILAPIFATIIQLASSRKREYLADASAAKMTRNPGALASALRKISGDPEPLPTANKGTQQLFIVNPLKGKAKSSKQNLFSTHPPIEERIRILSEMS